MILYNVTVSLDASIHTDWLEWIRNVHIPEVMATGYFVEHKICKLLVDDEITYAIQYNCESLEKLNEYQEKYSPALQQKHTDRYKGKFGAFRTLLEIIE
ncbi:MAG: DUF4286 family protein [Flavobacteriales bacterium]|nr:DUF4286 family protein [Flavobacteriales bacterium]